MKKKFSYVTTNEFLTLYPMAIQNIAPTVTLYLNRLSRASRPQQYSGITWRFQPSTRGSSSETPHV